MTDSGRRGIIFHPADGTLKKGRFHCALVYTSARPYAYLCFCSSHLFSFPATSIEAT